MSEHLAHGFDSDALCQGPCREGVTAHVHRQVDVQLRHARYELQLVVALLVAHQIEVVVIFAQYGYGFRKQDYGVWHPGFQTLVTDAVVLALSEHVRLLDLHKVGVGKTCIAGEDEHVACLLGHAV